MIQNKGQYKNTGQYRIQYNTDRMQNNTEYRTIQNTVQYGIKYNKEYRKIKNTGYYTIQDNI